ncbi:MAG: type II toxin-antitoxin system VapC family toxin [Candidatus Helarchaeota archaeon]
MMIKLFIDTGAFVAYHNKKDKNHEKATNIFKEIAKGRKYSKLITSDYIIDEAITTCRVRTKRHDASVELGDAILKSESIYTLKVEEQIFSAAWELFKKYSDKSLSFTDCTTIILMQVFDINSIFSFDDHFYGFGFLRIF